MASNVLIIGACGQIGSELTQQLREERGAERVIAADLKSGSSEFMKQGPFEKLDATDEKAIRGVIQKYDIKEVYQLAAMLSGTAEKMPMKAWALNMNSLFNLLECAREGLIDKLFWPSSIAVFGPSTPKENTPQHTIMEPSTVYGISKQAGERWCAYYHEKYDVDVRSIRYPGLISYKTAPGGGTTDYAIEIYEEALRSKSYTCFLEKNTALPMMFMNDAIRATIELMQAPSENIQVRSSYNLGGMRITPEEVADSIRQTIPEFKLSIETDFRQAIAETWPSSIDDTRARQNWGWKPEFDLAKTTETMLAGMREKIQAS